MTLLFSLFSQTFNHATFGNIRVPMFPIQKDQARTVFFILGPSGRKTKISKINHSEITKGYFIGTLYLQKALLVEPLSWLHLFHVLRCLTFWLSGPSGRIARLRREYQADLKAACQRCIILRVYSVLRCFVFWGLLALC